jgi:hypothetical protein
MTFRTEILFIAHAKQKKQPSNEYFNSRHVIEFSQEKLLLEGNEKAPFFMAKLFCTFAISCHVREFHLIYDVGIFGRGKAV